MIAEERHSLASDYSNMTLPFIDMGNIQIHEMLGKVRKRLKLLLQRSFFRDILEKYILVHGSKPVQTV